jgi:hypothetical protein
VYQEATTRFRRLYPSDHKIRLTLALGSLGLWHTMLSKHILSIELSFSLCLHLGLAFCPPGHCRSMAPLSPLPPFQVPLPLPLLLLLSPVSVRDRLPANVLVVLCVCRSVGNQLPPTLRTSKGRILKSSRPLKLLHQMPVDYRIYST